MPGLKEVRARIASVNSTKQITSAMKMVSAAKLRKAQGSIVKLRPYASKLNELLTRMGDNTGDIPEAVYFTRRPVQKVLIVVISSNRGLCGAFNANAIKSVLQLLHDKYATQHKQGNVHLYCPGKKAAEFFQRRNYNIIAQPHEIFDQPGWDNITAHAEKLMQMFADGEYDTIELVYHVFRNAASQLITSETFLPVSVKQDVKGDTQADYIFEPGREEILSDLIPRSLKTQFYKAVLDSWASEHGARMTAMHKATDNAEELLRNLKLTYNKARQAAITREIIEIVSGASALEG